MLYSSGATARGAAETRRRTPRSKFVPTAQSRRQPSGIYIYSRPRVSREPARPPFFAYILEMQNK